MIDQESKFPNIGKELPYTVPNDFFDKLPAQTLRLAKERMDKRRRTKKVIRFFAVATSAAAVIMLFVVAPFRDFTPVRNTPQVESIDAVLQGMSDEDLNQLSATYSSEDLEGDFSQ